jgi:hypothetical protein
MPQTTEIDYLDGEFSVQESEPSTIPECIELIGEAAVVDELPEQVSPCLQARQQSSRGAT